MKLDKFNESKSYEYNPTITNSLNKKQILGMILALFAVIIVFFTEQILKPGYFIKSVIKVACFMGSVFLYCLFTKSNILTVLRIKKVKNLKLVLLLMGGFLLGTLLLFLIFKNFLDLASIRESLMSKENLTKQNCIFVFLYIIIFNSFLEEGFFRGFIFQNFSNKLTGTIMSSLLWSLYHIGIFITWFNPFIFILCLIGLAIVGGFLQWISLKLDSVLGTYIIHSCANIAINIIGFLLIYEIL